MKTWIIFIITTTAMVLLGDFYFEYIINREVEGWIVVATSVGMIIVATLYLWYLVKLLQNILKLK